MHNEDLREIYNMLREIRADIAGINATIAADKERLQKVEQKCDRAAELLNKQIGRDGVMVAVYSFVGAVIVAIVSWVLVLIKGGHNG